MKMHMAVRARLISRREDIISCNELIAVKVISSFITGDKWQLRTKQRDGRWDCFNLEFLNNIYFCLSRN